MAISAPSVSTPAFKGDLKSLFNFFFPVLLMGLAGNLAFFIEKVIFGRLSPEALIAGVDVHFIARIFQVTFVYLASLAQVYVGHWYGAKEYSKIGAGVWQLIWLSLLSTLVTIPIGLWIGKIYFRESVLQQMVMPYLYTYLAMNFLFPLRAALTGFYLGLGKASWVTSWTLGSELLQLLLSSIFILGIPGWIPSFGLMGGAMSHFFVQIVLCLFLFLHFLRSKSHEVYQTKRLRLQPKLFGELIKPGFFRLMTQGLQAPSWAAISYQMTQIGDPYTSVLSVGVTLFYFLAFFVQAFQTSMMSLNAQLVGAKAYELIKKTMKNGCLLLTLFLVPLGVPMLFFAQPVYQLLFPRVALDPSLMQSTVSLIWMCIVTGSMGSILNGVLLAFKDTRFLILSGLWSIVYDLGICTCFAMSILKISSAYFWLLISLGHILMNLVYYWRIQKLQYKTAEHLV